MKKKLLFTTMLTILGLSLFAQPQAFKYSAVAIGQNGEPVTGTICVRLLILEDAEDGTIRYLEEHETTPNAKGKFNLYVGRGMPSPDLPAFADIDWANHEYWLHVAISHDCSTSFTNYGVSQLLSIPYALYAAEAGATTGDLDKDSLNELQTLSLVDNKLVLSEGGEVVLPKDSLALSGNQLSISGSNTITLPGSGGSTQTLTIEGRALTLSPEGGSVTLPTDSLSINGNQLSVVGGNTVTLPTDGDTDAENELQMLSINNNKIQLVPGGGEITLPEDGDRDSSNEIQTLSLSRDTIRLSSGGAVKLPAKNLSLDGDQLSITGGNTVTLPQAGDETTTDEIQTLNISGDTIRLTQGGEVILPAAELTLEGNQLTIAGGNTVTLPEDAITALQADTGIVVTIDGNVATIRASNDESIWNAYALRGRKIRGMEPTNKTRFLVFDAVDQEYNYTTGDTDVEVDTNGVLKVYGLRGRQIRGMEPTNKTRFLVFDAVDQEYNYTTGDTDVEVDTNGVLKVYGLRGRQIRGMEPTNQASVFVYDPTQNDGEYGFAAPESDITIEKDEESRERKLVVSRIQDIPINISSGEEDGTVLTFRDGGLEAQQPAFAIPVQIGANLDVPMISLTNSNNEEPNLSVLKLDNNGRYGLQAVSREEQGTFSPSEVPRSFTYPAAVFGEHFSEDIGAVGVLGKAVPNGNQFGIGGLFMGNNAGVLAIGFNGNAIRGVGRNGSNAALFEGRVVMLGGLTLTESVASALKLFKIDHPLDPANKYLYHASIESPDLKNMYDGTIRTDSEGFATVELPSYFEALNKDFRYQLTCIGVFAQAIIAKKVENNRFTIQTDKPNVEVSWQVTGIRKDPYAEAYRTVPEVEKTQTEKGKYLHPALYGQPKSLQIRYENIEQK